MDKFKLEDRMAELTNEQAEQGAELARLRQRFATVESEYAITLRRYDLGNDDAAIDVEALRNERNDLQPRIEALQTIVAEYPGRLQAIQEELDALTYRDSLAGLTDLRAEALAAATGYQASIQAVLAAYDVARAAVTAYNAEHGRLQTIAMRTGRNLPNRALSVAAIPIINGEWFTMASRRQAGLRLLIEMLGKFDS